MDIHDPALDNVMFDVLAGEVASLRMGSRELAERLDRMEGLTQARQAQASRLLLDACFADIHLAAQGGLISGVEAGRRCLRLRAQGIPTRRVLFWWYVQQHAEAVHDPGLFRAAFAGQRTADSPAYWVRHMTERLAELEAGRGSSGASGPPPSRTRPA